MYLNESVQFTMDTSPPNEIIEIYRLELLVQTMVKSPTLQLYNVIFRI